MIFTFWIISSLTLVSASHIATKLRLPVLTIQFLIATLITYYLYTQSGHFFDSSRVFIEGGTLSLLNKVILSAVFSYILSDITDLKVNSHTIKYGLFSFLLPFIFGVVLYYCTYRNDIKESVSVGVLYSMVAIPILFSLLREVGYSAQRSGIIIQSAIVIDIVAWVIFSFYIITFESLSIVFILVSALLPIILRLLSASHVFYGVLLFILFFVTELLGSSGVISGFVFCVSSFYLGQKVKFPISKRVFVYFITYLATPFIITYGLLQVDYGAIMGIGIKEVLLFILFPILFKVISNFIFVYYSLRPSVYAALYESILFNARGLTEIILLNLLFSLSLINSATYIAFFIMSLLSSILPTFLPQPRRKIQ